MDGEVVPNGVMLAYGAAPGPGGTLTAIVLPFRPLPFFQQKGSPKRRSVWWNRPAQQTARFREDKAGEMELGACPELRKGLVRVCGILVARDSLWSAWGHHGAWNAGAI